MKLRRLIAPAVIVPQQEKGKAFRHPVCLGAGSIIALVDTPALSPITGKADEITVRLVDPRHNPHEFVGFIATRTPLSPITPGKALHSVLGTSDDRVGPWDQLRQQMMRTPGWSALRWLSRFGAQAKHVPLLHAVIRELGGRITPTEQNDPMSTVVRALRIILRKEITMKDIKESRDMSPVTSKKAAAAAAAAPEKTPAKKSSGKKRSLVAKAARSASTTKSKKKGEKKPAPRVGARGPRSPYAGMTIIRLAKEDPNTPETAGAESWACIKKGMTYEDFVKAGGRRADIPKWVKRKNIKMVQK